MVTVSIENAVSVEMQLNTGLNKLPLSNGRRIKIRPTAKRDNRVIG